MEIVRGIGRDQFIYALDYDGGSDPVYIGLATAGQPKSAAVWQIRKLTYSASRLTDIQFANGSRNFDQVWNDRASLSYS